MEKFNHKTASMADLKAVYDHLGEAIKELWDKIKDPEFADEKESIRADIGRYGIIRACCDDEILSRLSNYK